MWTLKVDLVEFGGRPTGPTRPWLVACSYGEGNAPIEWCERMGSGGEVVSPPQPTGGLGIVVSCPSGVWTETHFGVV